jgi:hypothetical protein
MSNKNDKRYEMRQPRNRGFQRNFSFMAKAAAFQDETRCSQIAPYVIHSLVSCLTNEKNLEKNKSKCLSTSFGIARRVCKIVLRRLCQRRCVRAQSTFLMV